ncbi:heavy metal-binding domain-containing protein [Hymenobacter canadensis]|uniref:Heavy metal-binding domain-containing protein n=1 Tax=Hymenobacter canadensis TaxID=2999067 RepID=A0ABY7LQ77_9BACT|nr:heavy metal-binding domain-containing protein [Hymenobacter canadensis]WBA41048.1 heavy metal-binding domain-containing protein [Hymenobacter canadensis]
MRSLSITLFAAAALLMASCNSQPATEAGAASQATTAPADSLAVPTAAAAYICPMKCEGSASDKPGKCPVCEMALEPAEASQPAS